MEPLVIGKTASGKTVFNRTSPGYYRKEWVEIDFKEAAEVWKQYGETFELGSTEENFCENYRQKFFNHYTKILKAKANGKIQKILRPFN